MWAQFNGLEADEHGYDGSRHCICLNGHDGDELNPNEMNTMLSLFVSGSNTETVKIEPWSDWRRTANAGPANFQTMLLRV